MEEWRPCVARSANAQRKSEFQIFTALQLRMLILKIEILLSKEYTVNKPPTLVTNSTLNYLPGSVYIHAIHSGMHQIIRDWWMHRYVIKSMAKVTGRAWVVDIQVFTGKCFQPAVCLKTFMIKCWIKTTKGKANGSYGPDWSAESHCGLCGLQHKGLTSTPQLPRSLGSFLCPSPSLNPQSIFWSHFFPCISKARTQGPLDALSCPCPWQVQMNSSSILGTKLLALHPVSPAHPTFKHQLKSLPSGSMKLFPTHVDLSLSGGSRGLSHITEHLFPKCFLGLGLSSPRSFQRASSTSLSITPRPGPHCGAWALPQGSSSKFTWELY